MMNDDMELLQEYVTRQSEQAFEALVTRYVDLVYSAAARQVRNPHLAEEVSQAVFIILARKAHTLGSDTIISTWLYRTAGFVAADALKTQRRRAQREQEAYMQSLLEEPVEEAWRQIAPLLDRAIAGLNDKDRHAIVLRFFRNKSLSEIAATLGGSEDAAKKRVNRALEKLRLFFARRGVALTTTIIAAAISANSVQAAPAVLAKTATAAALAKGATASGSTLTLIKGALKLMAWTHAKTIVTGSVVVLAIAMTTGVLIHYHPLGQSDGLSTPNDWTVKTLSNAGSATPENALKSLLWGVNTGNTNVIFASMTLEERTRAQEEWQQTFEPSFALLKRQIGEAKGFQILGVRTLPADRVVVDLYSKGRERAREYSFQKVGNEWKCDNIMTERAATAPAAVR